MKKKPRAVARESTATTTPLWPLVLWVLLVRVSSSSSSWGAFLSPLLRQSLAQKIERKLWVFNVMFVVL
jgi:hypothetical protein